MPGPARSFIFLSVRRALTGSRTRKKAAAATVSLATADPLFFDRCRR